MADMKIPFSPVLVTIVSLGIAIAGAALGYNAFLSEFGSGSALVSPAREATDVRCVNSAGKVEIDDKAQTDGQPVRITASSENVSVKSSNGGDSAADRQAAKRAEKPVAKHGISITPSAKDTPRVIWIKPEKVERQPCLFSEFHNGEWVTGWGIVKRVLPDDTKPPCHQRFILVDSKGSTMMVANNIDRWPRLPDVNLGDVIEFKGEFKNGDRGYVIHWTHPDTSGRRPGGYVRKAR